MAVEEEFCIEIPDQEAEKILSVDDAISFICQHPQARLPSRLTLPPSRPQRLRLHRSSDVRTGGVGRGGQPLAWRALLSGSSDLAAGSTSILPAGPPTQPSGGVSKLLSSRSSQWVTTCSAHWGNCRRQYVALA